MTDLQISKRGALVLIAKEGLALSTYKDIVGVKTWSIGITSMSGHDVDRYIGKPSTMARAFEVFLWVLKRYEKTVIDAFAPMKLNEHQLAAAVSFHYNTGAITRASWVQKFKAGDVAGARRSFMQWSKPKAIIGRRRAERDLFFDGKWPQHGDVLLYDVNSKMKLGKAQRVDARKALHEAWGNDPNVKPIPKPVKDVIEDADKGAESKTLWATIISIIASIAATFGDLSETVQLALIAAIVILGGFIIYERMRKRGMAKRAKAVL